MAYSGPTLVQYTQSDTQTENPAVTFANAQTKGNTNLVFYQSTGIATGVTDNNNNTYINVANHLNVGGGGIGLWYCSGINAAAAGACVVTTAYQNIQPDIEVVIIEITGLCLPDGFTQTDPANGLTTVTITMQTSFLNALLFVYETDGTAHANGINAPWAPLTGGSGGDFPSSFGAMLAQQNGSLPGIYTSSITTDVGVTACTLFAVGFTKKQIIRAKMLPIGL